MALPVSTIDKDLQKRKTITNLPYNQDNNQNLPLIQESTQPQAAPVTPPERVGATAQPQAAPATQPERVQTTAPAPVKPVQPEYKAPTFTPEQAAALASTPPPPPPPTAQQTLEEARVQATQGFSSEEMDQLNNLVQQYLQDPSLGGNPDLAKQKALEEFDRERAQGFEQWRQTMGHVAGKGAVQEEGLAMQLAGATERARLGRDIDIQQQELKRQQMMEALALASGHVGQQQEIWKGNIEAMIQAAGGALGFAELAMKEKILLSEQEYDRWKTEYQGNLQTALQSNDIEAVRDNLNFQLDFEAQQAELGREFTAEQSALNRALKESLAHLEIDAQREFIDLKSKIDKDMLLTEQDFSGGQAALDRAMEQALTDKNIQAQFDLQSAQNEFNALMQANEFKYKEAERVATQAWKTGERISEQQWKTSTQYLDQQHQLAMQNNDIVAQKDIEQMKADLELHLLTQNMEHQEKMQYMDQIYTQSNMKLQSQLKKGETLQEHQLAIEQMEKQSGLTIEEMAEQSKLDTTMQQKLMGLGFSQEKILQELQFKQELNNQKQIATHMHTLEMEKIESEQGHEEAMAYINKNIEIALKGQDFMHAKALQKLQFENEYKMHLDNMHIQELQLELEKQNIDFQQIQQAIAAGQIAPEAAIDQLMAKLPPEVAANLKPPDPKATQDALTEDWLMAQYQFALSHSDGKEAVAEFSDDGQFIGLKDDYMQQFNDYYNETQGMPVDTPDKELLNEIMDGEKSAIDYFSDKSTSDPMYKSLLEHNSTKEFSTKITKVGWASTARDIYANMPPVGGFVKHDGALFQLSTKETDDEGGVDWKKYKITSVLTGESFWISTEAPSMAEALFTAYAADALAKENG